MKKISEEHKFNIKCLIVALICVLVDEVDGGLLVDKLISGLALWCIVGICFGFIIQNYREHKK